MTGNLGPYELNQIYTGDARELAESIPDSSVDLIFTDPVYWQIDDYEWLAETAARVLKDEGHLLAWQGTAYLPAALIALGRHLSYQWVLCMTHSNAMGGNIIFSKGIYTHWTPLIWFSRNPPELPDKFRDMVDVPLLSGAKENHKWHKSLSGLSYWLQKFTQPGAIVLDPFTGGGTVPAVCKMLGRNYLAFEIDSATADKARERVFNTQPPLFIPKPVQLELE